MAYELRTETSIDAPAERVWSILADFESYPAWNPFVVRIAGPLQLGERVEIELRPPGGKSMKFRPHITALSTGRTFAWLGRLFLPGLFDGEHRFEIVPLDDGKIRFVHSERFSGLLVPLLETTLNTKTRAGFEAMNEALKRRAEAH